MLEISLSCVKQPSVRRDGEIPVFCTHMNTRTHHHWRSVSEWLLLWTTLGFGTLLKGTSLVLPGVSAALLLPGQFSFLWTSAGTQKRKDLWLKYEALWSFYCTPDFNTFWFEVLQSHWKVQNLQTHLQMLNSSIVYEAGHLSPKGSWDGLQPLHDPINNSRSIKQKMMNGSSILLK